MTFWNSLKPSKRAISATHVELDAAKRGLSITWSDGAKTTVAARRLRQYCPCAGCVEEWTGKRTFSVDTIPEDMTIREVEPVGNYAITLTFGDDHNTGIFEWAYLRKLAAGEPSDSAE
jgi:DUF971 family protein